MTTHMMDPVLFAREALHFQAEPAQARVLDLAIRRGILNCRRQWGTSMVTAIKSAYTLLV